MKQQSASLIHAHVCVTGDGSDDVMCDEILGKCLACGLGVTHHLPTPTQLALFDALKEEALPGILSVGGSGHVTHPSWIRIPTCNVPSTSERRI